MPSYVLDSSVLLAILRSEIDPEAIENLVIGSRISSVNLAEIVTKCVELRMNVPEALAAIVRSKVETMQFDQETAILAGQLRERAPKGVLSLGDRACLATAILTGSVAVTADKIWTTLDLDCEIALIR